jgi:hypothetical protein
MGPLHACGSESSLRSGAGHRATPRIKGGLMPINRSTRHVGTAKRSRLLTLPRLAIVASVAVMSTAGVMTSATAAGNSLQLSGPASNVMGQNFNYVISGDATGPANHIVAWEQVNKQSGCATTYAAESTRAILQPAGLYGVYLWDNQAVAGTYSVTARFGAAHLGVHGICAYLINLSTGVTYAHGGAFWTNHN